MKRFLLDVNVVRDVLVERSPHHEPAAALWAALESGRGRGVLPAHAITTVHYLVQRAPGRRMARLAVEALLTVYDVAPVDGGLLRAALARVLGVAPTDVSVKAKTNESMGFVGRGEGLAVIAVATVGEAG